MSLRERLACIAVWLLLILAFVLVLCSPAIIQHTEFLR